MISVKQKKKDGRQKKYESRAQKICTCSKKKITKLKHILRRKKFKGRVPKIFLTVFIF